MGIVSNLLIGNPGWLGSCCNTLVLSVGREIDSSLVPFDHDSHELRTHAPGLALSLDVVARNGRTRHYTLEVRSARELGTVLRHFRVFRLAHLHREAVATILNHWLNV